MSRFFSSLLEFYRKRSFRGYWFWALFVLVLGSVCGEMLGEDLAWMPFRYRVYHAFQSLTPRPPTPKLTALVVIDDKDYWKGPLEHRVPIKRNYLAGLLTALSKCRPRAVGIDFDLRSPAPDVPESDLYAGETEILKREVERVSADFPVVLPVSLNPDKGALVPSILDSIPSRPHAVARGLISMPYDFRQVPTNERIGGQLVSSFALALVREAHPEIARSYEQDPGEFPFGSFASPAAFQSYTLPSRDLIRGGPEVCRAVDHKLVILAAAWSRTSYGRGGLIDTHDSPVGTVGKYLMHANYVETLLEEKTYSPLSRGASRAIELFFAFLTLHVLATHWSFPRKLAAVLGMTLLFAAITYVSFQNLGLFGDFVFPAAFLIVHAVIDYFWDLAAFKAAHPALPAGGETR